MAGGLVFKQGVDGQLLPELVWHQRRLLRTKFSSPVLRADNRVYCHNERELICVDVTDGSLVWTGQRYGHGQLLVGDHLLILGEKGEVALVDAADGQELGRIQAIESKTWSTPALAGDLLLVRNQKEAACYRLPVGAP